MSDPSSLPAASRPATSGSQFQTLFTFSQHSKGGIVPVGTLLPLNGGLYGTTNFGGHGSKDCYPGYGCGVIFELTTSGDETVVYRFTGKTTGARPYDGLIDVSGTLYGTTQVGGQHDKGAVFAITASGTETELHAFGGKDGDDPRASVTAVNGVLYGTTYHGGSSGTGALFSVTASGTEQVLHSFTGGADGALPLSSLIAVDNVLYGTTSSGGTSNNGTVFEINADGSGYNVIYSFAGGTDGASPFSGLLESNGTLYGTTELGGTSNKGTLFAISTSGSESVLHSFGAKKSGDGSEPFSGLTLLNGTLYGTTAYGGSENEGTIYTVTPSGSETVVHSFGGKAGRVPYANLTAMNGALYGVTIWGGNANVGTAFVYTP